MEAKLQPGSVIGRRFVIGSLLGSGGCGSVYEALQQDLGRRVAIKVLHGDGAASGEALSRFAREARAAAALGHPNIAQVTDFHTNAGEPPFLVMELLTGMTLGEATRRAGSLPPSRVCLVAYQLLAALDVAHRAGIVHRDVKPDNVFLLSSSGLEDFVKVLDFGVAKLSPEHTTSPLTSTGALLGTPAFMAPEQIAGASVDGRADLYAVGATMYYALSGRLPFEAESAAALLYAVVQHAPAPLEVIAPGVDPALANVITRAMRKDPGARFGSAAEMRAALEPFVRTISPPGLVSIGSAGPTLHASTPPPVGQPMAQPAAIGHLQPHVGPPFASASTPSRAPLILGAVLALVGVVAIGVAVAFALHTRGEARSGEAARSTDAGAPSGVVAAATSAGAPNTPSATVAARPASSPTAALPSTATPTSRPDAGAPRAGAVMTGRNPRISGGSWRLATSEASRGIIGKVMPEVTRCHVISELEAPIHDDSTFDMTVDPTGTVTGIRRIFAEGPNPKFEGCMSGALRQTKWPASAKGAIVRVSFTAPI